VKATEVTAGLVESNGSLLPGLWRDSLHVTCGLTTCTPGSAPDPTLGNEYGENFTFFIFTGRRMDEPTSSGGGGVTIANPSSPLPPSTCGSGGSVGGGGGESRCGVARSLCGSAGGESILVPVVLDDLTFDNRQVV